MILADLALNLSTFAELVFPKFVLALSVKKELCLGNVPIVG